MPGAHGQTGYTGLLVETAASSDKPDWKEMLNWASPIPAGHPLKRKFPSAYPDQVLPESAVPGITKVLYEFHEAIADLQRRFLRVIAEGIGCHETFFDEMVSDGPTLTRAIRYPPMGEVGDDGHVWAAEHGDINLITALCRVPPPRASRSRSTTTGSTPSLPQGQVIINTGIMLERLTNGRIPIGWHRVVAAPGYEGERHSVVQFCHPRPWTILSPVPSCCTPEYPQRFARDERRRRPRRSAVRDQPRRRRAPSDVVNRARAHSTGVAVGSVASGSDLTQNWAGTSIGTPHSSVGVPPLAPKPNVSDGDHVQPSGGMIWADLPVAVSVPSGAPSSCRSGSAR